MVISFKSNSSLIMVNIKKLGKKRIKIVMEITKKT